VNQKVLIVDDSKLARMAVIKVLKSLRQDWTSIEASNADEALAQVTQSSPDFALLDFNMPGKDGISLAVELQKSDPNLNVAVVSANHQIEVVNRVRAAGATFLPKPLTEIALKEFFDSATSQR